MSVACLDLADPPGWLSDLVVLADECTCSDIRDTVLGGLPDPLWRIVYQPRSSRG